MAARPFACPECGTPASTEDFQCPRCELVLNPDASVEEATVTEPFVVRALLSSPERRPTGEVPRPPPFAEDPSEEPETETDLTVAAPTVSKAAIPVVVAELDLALQPLHPFEAYVLSRIDGRLTVEAVAQAAGLSQRELEAVLHSLQRKGALALRDTPLPEEGPDERAAQPASEEREALRRKLNQRGPLSAPKPPPRTTLSAVALQRGHTDPGVGALQAAISLERKGQAEGAIRVLKGAIGRSKRPGPLYNRLALILLHQHGAHREAEELLRKALELEPDNAVYRRNLVAVLGKAADAPTASRRGLSGLLSKLIRPK